MRDWTVAGPTCHTPSLAATDVQTHSDQDATDEDIVCYCEWLTRDEIVAAIPFVRNLKERRETTRACTTCFGCEGDLDDLVAEHSDRFGAAL
jgi:NAD(P)H-nitrite reductase large subunit